ncbi:Sec-independent protein translocase subunit TatB [Dactylosporangium sp. AC04546]|uniref:Sec-independent protein translocase subunit TatB n=1 Tax=Dactylosporangium sp. AC04546 TaxID=2862460 RepID=UPI001EDED9B2|nr:Sec-independent protein translocase subunit TatB [Dactylosporangium sp. AC04546]WVK84610.1 Sec-independent protein translocase subunit TatB [Dactylosporangium sp. AC04546]
MGLENIGGWEFILIILVGLFIFGPDRLPKAIGDGMRMLRNVRQMARNATGDLSKELGTDIQLEDLHPKTFLRKHLLSEADEAALRKPLQGIYDDVKGVADGVKRDAQAAASAANSVTAPAATPAATPAPSAQPAVRASWDDVT